MFGKTWALFNDTVSGFLADDALSRAAAIAYFTIFSIAPLLLIVVAIASLAFGYEAAQRAIIEQFGGLMGKQSADAIQAMMQSAGQHGSGTMATIIGIVTLLVTASGAFGEIQSDLNTIWKSKPKTGISRLVRARIASLGLVLTLGFLMLVSLVISAALAALGSYVDNLFTAGHLLLTAANFIISLALLSVVFAAIYKFLPDTSITWRDVVVGAVGTALLFTIGKSLIGLYIGKTQVATSYGAAGSLIVILVWIYYSSLIFLLGAEFTRAFAEQHGSHAGEPKSAPQKKIGASAKPALALSRATPAKPAKPSLSERDRVLAGPQANLSNRHSSSDRLPSQTSGRPSLFQFAVAGLAVAVLPARRPKAFPAGAALPLPGSTRDAEPVAN